MFKVLPITSDLSAKMANMSSLCACMIVVFHATPAPEMGTFAWWVCHLLGREGVCKIAVPWFFVASGFLLAGHVGEEGWWRREVGKRMKSLVVPFYIWMAISFVFGLAVWYLKSQVFHLNAGGCPLETPIGTRMLLFSGFHFFGDIGPLWYVRCLVFLVLASPLIVATLRFWRMVLVGLVAVFLAMSILFWSGTGANFYFFFDRFITIRGLLYFTIGICLRLKAKAFGVSRCGWWFALLGLPILICENVMRLNSVGPLTGAVEALSVPFLIVGIFALVPSVKLPKSLTQSAFPMFLSHNIFLSTAAMGFAAIGMHGNPRYDLLMMAVRSIFTIGMCIAFSVVLRKLCPQVASLMFGGR